MEFFLEDYNQNTKRPMNLVLFEFALDHVARICRVLRMAQGHALLVGLGGSGRQSLTYLAAHIREQPVFAVEVTKSYQRENWVEDMQRLLTQAGADLKETVMLVTDAQVKKPFVLEDLNSLLDCGEIPNLFSQETFIPIADKVRANAKKEGRTRLAEAGSTAQLYDYFVECVKRKLHIVLL